MAGQVPAQSLPKRVAGQVRQAPAPSRPSSQLLVQMEGQVLVQV